ncbi:hypothetical protein D9M72_211390 [compost metagenome]
MLQAFALGHGARGHETVGAEGRQDVGRQQQRLLQARFLEMHRIDRRHARRPAEALEVARHRADHVDRVVHEVDAAVAVEVDRVLGDAAGHELRHAHGAGVAAHGRERVVGGAAFGAQEAFELAAEEGDALGRARVALREVEGQRGQRIDHAEVAHVAAVDGLDADDADDDFRRHAVGGLGARERLGVGAPEAHAGRDAHRVDEAAAVGLPVLHGADGARQHQARHVGQEARGTDGGAHPVAVEVAALGDIVGERHGVVPRGVRGAAAHRRDGGAAIGLGLLGQGARGPGDAGGEEGGGGHCGAQGRGKGV